MSGLLRYRFFAHSWVSDWNHGNAHFLRGLAQELVNLGHEVRCYEELGAWSLSNLVRNEGELAETAIEQFRQSFPHLDVRFYQRGEALLANLRDELRDSDVVIVHEWNEPEIVSAILSLKQELGFRALFHDTHHRAYTRPGELLRFPLHLFDGVLAFGEAIRRIYSDGFGISRVWTLHEAADVHHFSPQPQRCSTDVIWIGNWGDEERTRELQEFLIDPARELPETSVAAYGVRYPEEGRRILAEAGIEYRGYLPNLAAPSAYAQAALALHVPRSQYANGLGGIPTIRVFEALACGATLLCSPWNDAEQLFHPGQDYVVVQSCAEMKAAIQSLLRDGTARRQIGESGRSTVVQRHTCAHRARHLVGICEELNL